MYKWNALYETNNWINFVKDRLYDNWYLQGDEHEKKFDASLLTKKRWFSIFRKEIAEKYNWIFSLYIDKTFMLFLYYKASDDHPYYKSSEEYPLYIGIKNSMSNADIERLKDYVNKEAKVVYNTIQKEAFDWLNWDIKVHLGSIKEEILRIKKKLKKVEKVATPESTQMLLNSTIGFIVEEVKSIIPVKGNMWLLSSLLSLIRRKDDN